VFQALGREERHRTLFESIDEGFCVVEMLLMQITPSTTAFGNSTPPDNNGDDARSR